MHEFTFLFYIPANFYGIVPWFISLCVYMIEIALKLPRKSASVGALITSVNFNLQFKDQSN